MVAPALPQPRGGMEACMDSEADLLSRARRYSFRARMDKGEVAGPVFVAGSGSEVEDVNGKRWLDFNSGQMCSALGHNHPTVTAAIKEACDTLVHAHSSYFNVQEIRLAERLAGVMPAGLEKSLFLQSGSEANEAAVMIARQYTGGYEVASPHVSFHGMSDTARSLTFSGWHAGHGVLPSGSFALIAPYCYRCPLRIARRTIDRPAGRGHHRALVQRRRGHRAAARLAEAAPGDVPRPRHALDPRRGADRSRQARHDV